MQQVAPADGRKVLVGLLPAVWQAFARVYAPCGAAVAAVGEAAPQEAAAAAERLFAEVAAAVLREAAALKG